MNAYLTCTKLYDNPPSLPSNMKLDVSVRWECGAGKCVQGSP